MDLKFIITITATLLNILLGAFIIKKNFRSASNIYYGLMCISAGLWALSEALLYSIKDINVLQNYVVKYVFILGFLPPLFYLLFTKYFPYNLKIKKFNLIIIYSVPVILIILSFFNILKFQNTQIANGQLYQTRIFNDQVILSTYFFVYVLSGLIILINKLKKESGINYIQLKYLIISTSITFIFCGIVSIVLPLMDNFKFDWLGPIFTLINFFIIGYYLFYKVKRV